MNKAKHTLRSLLPRCAAAVQGGASSAKMFPPNSVWAQKHWIEELGVSAFKELSLEPHSAPKSPTHQLLWAGNILVCFLELQTCFSNSGLGHRCDSAALPLCTAHLSDPSSVVVMSRQTRVAPPPVPYLENFSCLFSVDFFPRALIPPLIGSSTQL